jgi:RND family efflux transporter MFP subunit
VNKVALAGQPKGVTVVHAVAARYRPSVRYVGTLEPWVAAKVGPQFISAYVDTVLVRPGAAVKRGAVLATLDCRNASALQKSVAAQARAVQTQQEAIAHEAQRISELAHGGFASPNEIEQKTAESASKQSQVLALQAQQLESSLKVNDCVLRAPFDGDVIDRTKDPGGFVTPGTYIVTVVDRSTIRLAADVPEDDFAAVAPGAPAKIHVIATGEEFAHAITRRAPAADPGTRTVHIEIDLPNGDRRIPVYTTAEIAIEVGEPKPVTQIPLAAASVRGKKADLFVVADGKAHLKTVPVVGESGGNLYLDPGLEPGTLVVLEGRTLLADGDPVVSMGAGAPAPEPSRQASRAAEIDR